MPAMRVTTQLLVDRSVRNINNQTNRLLTLQEQLATGLRVNRPSDDPIDARRAGIETVYQDLAVAPAMTIAENLFLGRELRRPGLLGSELRMLDKKKMLEESVARMAELKVGIRSMTHAMTREISMNPMTPSRNRCTATSLAALRTVGRVEPFRHAR